MAQTYAVIALRPLHRTIVARERDRIALKQRDYLDTALHPRPLFCQNEFAAGKILEWLRKQDRDLNRRREPLRAMDFMSDALFDGRPFRLSLAKCSTSERTTMASRSTSRDPESPRTMRFARPSTVASGPSA